MLKEKKIQKNVFKVFCCCSFHTKIKADKFRLVFSCKQACSLEKKTMKLMEGSPSGAE